MTLKKSRLVLLLTMVATLVIAVQLYLHRDHVEEYWLLWTLKTGSYEEKERAARLLAARGSQRAIPALYKEYRDQCHLIDWPRSCLISMGKYAARYVLYILPEQDLAAMDVDAEPLLLDFPVRTLAEAYDLLPLTDTTRRHYLITAVGQTGRSYDACPFLRRLLREGDEGTLLKALAAIDTLPHIVKEFSLEELIPLTRHESPAVRLEALRVLGGTTGDAARVNRVIHASTKDEEESVRTFARALLDKRPGVKPQGDERTDRESQQSG